MTIYTKKLTSLNPKKYEYISIEKAIHDYQIYVNMCLENSYHKLSTPKSFHDWLKTEI
jgi:hypothetical protein